MTEVDCITFDGKEYLVLDTISFNNNTYVYLFEDKNRENFLIQKLKKENNKEYVVNLDDKEEFEKALKEFYKKHNKNSN